MGSSTDDKAKAYAEFERKVRRTAFFDNLSHQVTAQMLKSALNQFGNVISVQFIPNYIILQDIPQAALVEMENQQQAKSLVDQINECPFMISGMPRPVRAKLAKPANFADRPGRPGRNITVQWLKPSDPNFDVAKKLKNIVRKHDVESSALLKFQEEEKLVKPQEEMLKNNYKKYEMIEKTFEDSSFYRLAGHYNITLKDD